MPDDYKPIVIEDIKALLLYERIKFQDLPMTVILVIHLISHMATGEVKITSEKQFTKLMFDSETVPTIQILLTLL